MSANQRSFQPTQFPASDVRGNEPKQNTEERKAEALTRIFVRPIASGMPLGFFAFGVGTLLAGTMELGWIPPAELKSVAIVMLGFVAPLELLSCIFAFLARDTAGATTMGVFAASWVGFATTWLATGTAKDDVALGMFSLMLAIIFAALASAAFSTKPMLALILCLAFARMSAVAAAQLAGSKVARDVGGIVSLLLAAFSIYGATAFLLEDMKQRAVLPVFRKGPAQETMEGNLADQLSRISREAGVREQL